MTKQDIAIALARIPTKFPPSISNAILQADYIVVGKEDNLMLPVLTQHMALNPEYTDEWKWCPRGCILHCLNAKQQLDTFLLLSCDAVYGPQSPYRFILLAMNLATGTFCQAVALWSRRTEQLSLGLSQSVESYDIQTGALLNNNDVLGMLGFYQWGGVGLTLMNKCAILVPNSDPRFPSSSVLRCIHATPATHSHVH